MNSSFCCVIHLDGFQESVHIEQEDGNLGKYSDVKPAGKGESSSSEDGSVSGVL